MLNTVPIKVSVTSNPIVKHFNLVHRPTVFCIRHVLLKNNISTIISAIIVNNTVIIQVAVVSSQRPLLPGTSLEPTVIPNCSGFKCQTAVFSVLYVMFQGQLSFVLNLLNVFLVWLPNFSLNLSLLAPIITAIILHFRF